MSNEFWSAIAGAVVGGLISLGIQMLALRAFAAERKEEASERRKALAHSLLFKMVRIYSHLDAFNAHIKEALDGAKKRGFDGQPWQIVLPLANSPDRVHFSADEMALLLSLKNDDLFNDIVSMDTIHNSTIDAFKAFSDLRRDLTSRLPAAMEGDVGTAVLTSAEMLTIQPKVVELNSLIKSMLPKCDRDMQDSWDALTRLRDTLNSKVGLTYQLSPKTSRTTKIARD